ncbi:MAG: hypothetical protein KatS3mg097_273 [Candidatus Parcubacteria bacterium]|nr:MAG: hypothetical protein KatS3mg097_273 [Candidatus Parcubacteria bacterium]
MNKQNKPKRKIIRKKQHGEKIEKIACELLKNYKYLVWKPIRVKFHSQDIFGLFDIIALNKKELKLIQVQKDRKRPYKIKQIFKLPQPKKIKYELWVYKTNEKKFKIYDKI